MRGVSGSRGNAAVLAAAAIAVVAVLRRLGVQVRPLRAGVLALSRAVPSAQPRAQKVFWRTVYGVMSRRADGATDVFMNYGYAPLASSGAAPSAAAGAQPDFGTALYDHVASATSLAGKDVLEVGCGRGGGAVHVFETHAPRSMVAVDLAPRAIRHCRERFARPNLRFEVADAEDLPFPEGSFDVVLNVESSHCYPDVPQFLREAHRVLRPGGLLLLADVRHPSLARATVGGPLHHEDIGDLRTQVAASPFALLEEEDITANVTRALQLDSERRRALVERRVPKVLQPQALNFAAVEGTPLHDGYVAGDVIYVQMVLAKQAAL